MSAIETDEPPQRAHEATGGAAARAAAAVVQQPLGDDDVERLGDALARERRRLDDAAAVLLGDGVQRRALRGAVGVAALAQFRAELLVVGQVGLCEAQHDARAGAVVEDLGQPLGGHVVHRRRAADRRRHHEAVRVGVRQRPQAVVVLAARRVPQADRYDVRHVDSARTRLDDRLAAAHAHVRRVVVEHRRHVLVGELVLGVPNQQARLAGRAIAVEHELHAGRLRHRRLHTLEGEVLSAASQAAVCPWRQDADALTSVHRRRAFG
eukprot:CAMPEP_0198316336 /NCGR_PEP_ID=MMETSP1450-20131203/6271_1 /TAXON_ID=753684 ORGANISM="Madagascaria erythrocladiodes, Strain CCMP3234" /NCGR_SAMPLE_ID=MMETSP1450 /ASSEMBLY_ACC=CAM_ASM_001115 /LENGTH=265 /DNA_ID=CAMNT_0044019487 /DNA_START=79 /DNA_END=874 /DNA_ORIENTATION=-